MSLQVLQDFRHELTNSAPISAIVGARVYNTNPIQEPTAAQAYLKFTKNKSRDMVSEEYIFQVVAFTSDLDERETLVDAIIDHFEDRRTMGVTPNKYFSISLISANDGRQKLKSGHYFTTITFLIKKTT